MPYLSLYRKYRPRTFAEIVGQRHVTQTLTNAVKANRIAHAYLLCGPRGTGKTSTARVLAMSLNCEHGPTSEPCGECESCRRIIAGNALDVIEIDAASNRGIDEIRELRERIGLAAADARMKIYIIDEVHMLTPEAYNAFLKTLEEPPAHVVFILATTEPHRVLPTILSRCQRFDFHRVGLRDLEATIRSVASKAELKVDDRAVAMLARAADGAARDALTLLDQAAAYAADDITAEVVTEILGGIDFDLVAEFADILIRRNVSEVLAFIERVVADGKDLRQLVGNLIEHFRNLLLLSVDPGSKEAVALPEESLTKAVEQASALSSADILRTLDTLAETDRELRFTGQPRLLVELAAVRLCRAAEPGGAAAAAQTPALPARVPIADSDLTPPPAAAVEACAPPVRETEPAAPRRARKEAAKAPAGPLEVAETPEPAGLAEIRRRWDEVMADLRKAGRHSEGAFLRESVPVSLEDGVLTLEFGHQFHHDQMMSDKRREAVAEVVQRLFGVEVKVKCRMAPEGMARAGEPAEGRSGKGGSSLNDVLSIFPGSEVEQ